MVGFLDVILKNPLNEDNYLILADYLEEQGDPLGNLTRLAIEAIKKNDKDKLEQFNLERRIIFQQMPAITAEYSDTIIHNNKRIFFKGDFHFYETDGVREKKLKKIPQEISREVLLILLQNLVEVYKSLPNFSYWKSDFISNLIQGGLDNLGYIISYINSEVPLPEQVLTDEYLNELVSFWSRVLKLIRYHKFKMFSGIFDSYIRDFLELLEEEHVNRRIYRLLESIFSAISKEIS